MANKERPIWASIEAEYIAGNATLKVLAELHGEDYGYLRAKAFKGKWTNKRADYREAVLKSNKAEKELQSNIARTDFDAKTIRSCEVATAHAAIALTNHQEALNAGQADSPFLLTKQEVKAYLEIVSTSQQIVYRTWDIPTPVHRIEAKVDKDIAPADSMEDEIKMITDELFDGVLSEMVDGNGNGNGNGESHNDEN